MKLFKPADHVVIGTGAGTVESSPGQEIPKNLKVTHFAGIALAPSGMVSCESLIRAAPVLDLADLVDAPGEWTAIATTGDEYVVFADAYGYAPVFYALVPGRALVVSDSFQGTIAGLGALGVGRDLDVENYLATVALEGQNILSDRTMARQVRILPMDHCLHVTSTATRLLPRSALGGAESDTSYESVLSKGLQWVRETMSAFALMEDVPKILTLSGGVDSRLALAMLTSAGVAHLFQTRTVDPRTFTREVAKRGIQRDMAIADRLRRDHGMRLEDPFPRNVHVLNFEETLGHHQSHRSNYNYNYVPLHAQSTVEPSLLTVRGGGGEILRSTDGGLVRARQFAERADGDETEQDWLVRKQFILNHAVLPEFRPMISEYLKEAFAATEGGSLEERLNHQYLRTRNRSHFGHIRQGSVGNEISVHLVSNAHFLQASRLIPFEDKAAGALVRDLFELAPELLRYPFENEEWTHRLGTGPQVDIDFEGEPWAAELDASLANRPTRVQHPDWRAGRRAGYTAFDSKLSATNYVKHGFDTLLDAVDTDLRDDLAAQHANLLGIMADDAARRGQVLAKVASALDVFLPPTIPGSSVRVETSPAKPGLPRSTINLLSSGAARGFPVPEQDPVLVRDETGLIVDAHPGPEGLAPDLEFAFYLFHDGVRVETRWYEPSSSMRFEQPGIPGRYNVTSFMRRRGGEGYIWVDRSADLYIEPAPTGEATGTGRVGAMGSRPIRWVRRQARRVVGRLRKLRHR